MDTEERFSQRFLCTQMHLKNLADIPKSLKNDHARYSLFNAQRAHPAPWLNQAFYGRNNKIAQSSAQFQVSLKLRLLMTVQNATNKRCACTSRRKGSPFCIDLTHPSQYLHGLTCPDMSGSIIHRHDRITKLIQVYAEKTEGVSCRWNKTTYNLSNP